MNLRNIEKFMENFWDWTFLNKCFWPTGIKVTDIDGFVERNDKFLFIETKEPGVEIPLGQERVFESLIRRGDSYMVIWGEQGKPPYDIFYRTPNTVERNKNATEADIQRFTERWFKSVNQPG